jgi:hypothetical protein
MRVNVKVDLHGLPKNFEKLAKGLKALPPDASRNPLAQALNEDYRKRLLGATRPRVSQSGRWFGNVWPRHADQYTRKTDGVTVPAWGGVPKLHGRGKVKGRLTSEAVGRGSGSRIKAGDWQLGRRAGGLFSHWTTSPLIMRAKNTHVLIASNKSYARHVARFRNWFWSHSLKQSTGRALRFYSIKYLRELTRKSFSRAR